MRAHASLRNISSISAQWQGSTSNENQEGAYIWETSLGTRRCLDTKLSLGVYIFWKIIPHLIGNHVRYVWVDSKILLRVLFAEFRRVNNILVSSMRKVEKTWQILKNTPAKRWARNTFLFRLFIVRKRTISSIFLIIQKIITFNLKIIIHFLSILFVYSMNNSSVISFVLKIILHFPSILFVYSLKFQFFFTSLNKNDVPTSPLFSKKKPIVFSISYLFFTFVFKIQFFHFSERSISFVHRSFFFYNDIFVRLKKRCLSQPSSTH